MARYFLFQLQRAAMWTRHPKFVESGHCGAAMWRKSVKWVVQMAGAEWWGWEDWFLLAKAGSPK
jgi:hypothetical protein